MWAFKVMNTNNNKLIFIVSVCFALLVNIPRLIFLYGNRDTLLATFLDVSVQDLVLRIVSLFLFCMLILKFNIDWAFKWFKKKPFVMSSILSFGILFLWNILFQTADTYFNADSSTINHRFTLYVYFFTMMMLLIVSRTIVLNNQSKTDAIIKEKLKQQSLQNELSALKNQVNPHFLFNSLNTLSLLVLEDPKRARKFIHKLSGLYREILQSNHADDLIALEDELKILENYSFLIAQRYEDSFHLQLEIDPTMGQKKLPILSLQLLVENAIKHNEISTERPLHIKVYEAHGYIVVSNKIQKRTGPVESTHVGLSNLNTRCQLLTKKELIISDANEAFTVKVPLV